MAMTFNFTPMDYSRIPEHERQARQNYYSSLEGIGKAMGSAAETLGEAYDGREQRRKKEEADKRQWNNMLAEQKYKRERDSIADARYKEELDRKLKEIEAKNADLDAMKKRIGPMGDEKFFEENYGPSSAIHYHAFMTSRDSDNGQRAAVNLANSMMQQQMLNENREQARIAAEKEAKAALPDKTTRDTVSRLTNSRIDINGGYIPKDKNEASRWLSEINAALMAQEGITDHSDYSSKVTMTLLGLKNALEKKIAIPPPTPKRF